MAFLVIANDASKTRNYVSTIEGIDDGNGAIVHLDTRDFSAPRQTTLKSIPYKALIALQEHHSSERLTIEIAKGDTTNICQTVEQYGPAHDGTHTRFMFCDNLRGEDFIIDVPPEAFDQISALNKKLGLSNCVNLSTKELQSAFKNAYENKLYQALTPPSHQPLDITPSGQEAIEHYLAAHQEKRRVEKSLSDHANNFFPFLAPERDHTFCNGPITADMIENYKNARASNQNDPSNNSDLTSQQAVHFA